MIFQNNEPARLKNRSVIFKRSILSVCIMAASAPSCAQNTASAKAEKTEPRSEVANAEVVSADVVPVVEEVVVTGMRQSLSTAQDIKRSANTVMDSITAEDLGSFPDKSVAEALQRVAGVTVNRFAASSDTSHFSAEPSGVLVRGLNQVRTEFNGRDSFSANSGRGLSWGDISPELMSGVDTYKNQTAELIEGGIAGTVNMRTRVPFDQDGQMAALTMSANYGDLSESVTPEASGLYSNRWQTDNAGEFGMLFNIAYSDVETRTQGVQLNRMNRVVGAYGDEDALNFIPDSANFRDTTYMRERTGFSFAGQWQDDDGGFVATLQLNRSQYENEMEEYVIGPNMGNASYGQSVYWSMTPGGAGSDKIPMPAEGTADFTFDENGVFQTGTPVMPLGYNTAVNVLNDQGEQFVIGCQPWETCDPHPTVIGESFTSSTRGSRNKNITQDVSLNLKWEISDRIHSQWDVQYVESEVTNYDVTLDLNSYVNPTIDLTGELPSVILNEPTSVNWSERGLTNAHNYFLNSIMDHVEDSSGDELAARADFVFDVDNGWLESVKVGGRYAKRQQNVNWSTYNYQGVSNTYTDGASYFFIDNGPDAATGFKGYPEFYTAREWDSTHGNIRAADGSNTFIVADIDLLNDQARLAETMSTSALNLPVSGWDPICSNTGDRAGELAGTCFTPAEMVDVEEVTNALYFQVNFGGDDLLLFDRPLSGNFGIRYVTTKDVSSGGEVFPNPPDACEPIETEPGQPAPPIPKTAACYVSDDDMAYMNSASIRNSASAEHTNILPSLNVKYDLNDEWLIRLAMSRAMSRPDVGNMRNFVSINAKLPDTDSVNDPLWVKDENGEIVGANVYYNADSQNPFLKPITADQIDLSVEHYFADVGSFSAVIFAKHFNDYIQEGRYIRDYTNDGVTRAVEVKQPLNGEGAKISGIELAYQRFFDFLPAPYDGLGFQTNYTYVRNKGITNTNISSNTAEGTTQSDQSTDSIQVDRLEGLSDHAYNLVLMYEHDNWSGRLAYNWRSEYMVTAIDCCVAVPIWNDATGYLDGSIRYDFNDNVSLSFEGSNLLNETTTLEQQVQDSDRGGLRLQNASFQNDRRFTATLRLTY